MLVVTRWPVTTSNHCYELQAMLEQATLEVGHLKHRGELDGKLLRLHQSKAFFMEEVAHAERRKADMRQVRIGVCLNRLRA